MCFGNTLQCLKCLKPLANITCQESVTFGSLVPGVILMAGIITEWFVARTVANFDLIQIAVLRT